MPEHRTALAFLEMDYPYKMVTNPYMDESINIEPTRLYKVGYIKLLFTVRHCETLNHNGLRSLCGYYLGQDILDAIKRASTAKYNGRRQSDFITEKNEGVNDGKEAKDRVEKKTRQPKVQRVSACEGVDPLSDQREKIKRLRS